MNESQVEMAFTDYRLNKGTNKKFPMLADLEVDDDESQPDDEVAVTDSNQIL